MLKIFEAGKSETKYYIVSELAESRDLYDWVKEGNNSEQEVRRLFKQIVSGLDHIHSKGYAHRDMKLENCFFHNNVIKIADFGFLKQDHLLKTQCGTPGYQAPEIKHMFPHEYEGTKVDIFALGVMLYMMLVGSLPFREAGDKYH